METLVWAGATVAILVVVSLIFKKPIARLIDRVNKIGPTGIDTTPSGQHAAKSELGPAAADEFARLFDNQLVIQREEWIRTELARIVGTNQTQKEKILLRILAAQSIVQQFETTYRTIFGSQISALQITNATPDGVHLHVFETLFNQAEARDKTLYANFSFESWLGYVESQLLVTRKDDKFYITLVGREFLKYLVHQGYTLYKYG